MSGTAAVSPNATDAAQRTDDRNLHKPAVRHFLVTFAAFEYGAAKFPGSGPSCAIQRNSRSDGWVSNEAAFCMRSYCWRSIPSRMHSRSIGGAADFTNPAIQVEHNTAIPKQRNGASIGVMGQIYYGQRHRSVKRAVFYC